MSDLPGMHAQELRSCFISGKSQMDMLLGVPIIRSANACIYASDIVIFTVSVSIQITKGSADIALASLIFI